MSDSTTQARAGTPSDPATAANNHDDVAPGLGDERGDDGAAAPDQGAIVPTGTGARDLEASEVVGTAASNSVTGLPAPRMTLALEPTAALGGRDSLSGWMELYRQVRVVGAPHGTRKAKEDDLRRFRDFFVDGVGHDIIDGWTPAVSRAFIAALKDTDSRRLKVAADGTKIATKLKANSINRVLATIRHFGSWVHGLRPLLAGKPFEDVKDMRLDRPAWRGLTKQQILRLRAAVDMRLAVCTRKNQEPLLEAAVFYVLHTTGLREHELVALDLEDYHDRGFHNVKRKGNMVTSKVPVPQEARDMLDRYLEKRGNVSGPLFMSARYAARLTPRAVIYMCERLSDQANAGIKDPAQRFKLTPHMCRHTFLKAVADKEGVHRAQELSGNVGKAHIWRYTKPSEEEIEAITEALYA